MRPLLILSALALSACTTVQASDAAPDGSLVAIGEPVRNGDAVVTPMEVGEDSRCPRGVQCVWAGRVTVLVRIERGSRSETEWVLSANGTLVGKDPFALYAITLDEVVPEKPANTEIASADYRFRFGT